eukprot:Clim_evm3s198 gene=Clim_evmTU3s198
MTSPPIGKVHRVDAIVIGAGVSGLSALKEAQEAGFKTVGIEATDHVGGLWQYSDGYGVMSFTHINVSKHHYAYSDYPQPEENPDYIHHSLMAKYLNDFADHFKLKDLIRFRTKVTHVEHGPGDRWRVETESTDSDAKHMMTVYEARFVAIATGHHAKPKIPTFPGQSEFQGTVMHSVAYKDAIRADLPGHNVCVVGIGNSAVDVTVNAVQAGATDVALSTRSGAWIVPNYIFGRPSDNHVTRFSLYGDWKVNQIMFQSIISAIYGHPSKYGLNPKMGMLQTQPTVSPTLYHYLQRRQVTIRPNVRHFTKTGVVFEDGTEYHTDRVILCTGYRVDLPFLSSNLRKQILNQNTNEINLWKNAFAPNLDHTLAFIGFAQPASGGLIPVSEIVARYWVQLCLGKVKLPDKNTMMSDIEREHKECSNRYWKSDRHTIQRDPYLYCDDLGGRFGVAPTIWSNPSLALWLWISSCGVYQYRLQGPGSWPQAREWVLKVTPTGFVKTVAGLTVGMVALLGYGLAKYVVPSLAPFVGRVALAIETKVAGLLQ